MIKELKIKVFWKQNKRQYTVQHIYTDINSNIITAMVLKNYEGRIYVENQSEFYFMDYTGMTDAENNEIYTGFLVKSIKGGWVGEVLMNQGQYIIRAENQNEWPLWQQRKNCEVVGTVYEGCLS